MSLHRGASTFFPKFAIGMGASSPAPPAQPPAMPPQMGPSPTTPPQMAMGLGMPNMRQPVRGPQRPMGGAGMGMGMGMPGGLGNVGAGMPPMGAAAVPTPPSGRGKTANHNR